MKPYVAPFGKHKYCEGCADRQPFDERFTPLCVECAQTLAFEKQDSRGED